MSSIHTVIQHHPHRADMLPPLIEALGNLEPVVVTDPGWGEERGTWNAWRSFHACLEACPDHCGHLLIIQDDATPCPGFDNAARTALAVRPESIVCFYVGGGRVGDPLVQAAFERCARWAPLNRDLWVPLVATAFPRGLVTELLEWAKTEPYTKRAKGDDAVLGRFMRDKGITAWATIPNLVQHEDMVPSIMRRTHPRGMDRNRTAVCWIGDEDVGSLQW